MSNESYFSNTDESTDDNSSLLDEMNSFFDVVGMEQDTRSSVEVIRQPTSVNNDNLSVFYKKLEELGMNLDELKPILECQDNLLVLSGAGSGKTTALILKIIRDLVSGDIMKITNVNSVYGVTAVQVPSNILVSTFLRTGAEELKSSFREWCQKLGIVGIDYSTIHFKTIHAEVMDALKQMGVPLQVIESTDSLIRAVMNNYGIRSVTSTSRNVTIDEISDVASIIAYARNRLDNKRYDQPLMDDYRMDSILLDAVLKEFKLHRMASGKVDFEDMQEMLLEALQMNQNVRDFIAKRYDYVYVDEFQDTSQLQYELLKYYFSGSKRVTAIGDDDQTIYSWRGSDIEIITKKFEEDIKPTVLKLTTNYRCRTNILNLVKPSIEMNSNRHPKDLKAFKEGGEVSIVLQGNVNMLVEGLRSDLASGYKVGVLARVNADLLIPAIILELDGGLNFSLSKSVNMSNRMSRQVFGVIDLLTKRMTEEFEGYFKLFLPRSAWYEAKKLSDVLLTNKSLNLYNIPLEDLSHSLPNLSPFVNGLRKANSIGGVEAYIYILGMLEAQTFVGKSLYAKKARDLVSFVRRIILEHKSVKDLTISQIDNLFNSVLPERLARRIKYSKESLVKLTTVHEAKGKEWDSVYIWNDVDGAFPNQVGGRDITEAEFEEERRVHYIACTRAKDKLTIYSDEQKMSPFLKECDLTTIGANVTISEKQVGMQKVFKTKVTDELVEMKTDALLRSYIVEVTANSSLTDERVSNMEIVLNNFNFNDLIERLENQYGVHLSYEPEDGFGIIDLFFRELADELFNSGAFRA